MQNIELCFSVPQDYFLFILEYFFILLKIQRWSLLRLSFITIEVLISN